MAHMHNAVHLSAIFLHLQRPLPPFLHLQNINSQHNFDASGNVVQCGSYTPSVVLIQPQLVGGGIIRGEASSNYLPHMTSR